MAFTLTRNRYAVPTSAPSSLKINGTDSREFGTVLMSFPDLLLPSTDERIIPLDGRGGSVDAGAVYSDLWPVSLEMQIVGFNLDDVNDRRRELLRWIDMEQQRRGTYIIGSRRIDALKIELSGYKYWYKTGTILANVSTNRIWATGDERTSSEETTDGTTADKLVDSTVNFTTLSIAVGDIVHNTTDNTSSKVTGIDSTTQLALEDDIMVSGETYRIYQQSGISKWTQYISPGVQFEINGDSTTYYVESVQGDAQLTLTANYAGTSGPALLYRVERRMYLFANYSGESSTSSPYEHGFFRHPDMVTTESKTPGYAQDITIGFRSSIPYLLGDEFDFEQTLITNADSTGEFFEIEGTGNSICRPIIQISGNANTPEITAGDKAFTCQFDTNTTARDVQNKSDISATTFTSVMQHDTNVVKLTTGTEGIVNASLPIFGLSDGSNGPTVTYDAMVDGSDIDGTTSGLPVQDVLISNGINLNQGLMRILCRPQFDMASISRDHYLFDDGNNFTVKFSNATGRIEATDGTNTVQSQGQSFSAGAWIDIIVVWDINNLITGDAGTTNLFIAVGAGGTLTHTLDTSVSYTAAASATTLYVGHDQNTQNHFQGYIDEFTILDHPVETTFWTNLYASGTPVPAFIALDTNGETVSHSILTHLPMSGTLGDISSDTYFGSREPGTTLPSTSTTTTTVVVNDANSADIFSDNDRVIVYDESGYSVQTQINGAISTSTITVDSATGLDLIGVHSDLGDSNTTKYLDGGDVLDSGTNDIIISAWVNINGDPSQTGGIVTKKGSSAVTDEGYAVRFHSTGYIETGIGDGANGGWSNLGGGSLADDSKWHHVCVVFEHGVNETAYLDAVQTGTASIAAVTLTRNNANSFNVGGHNGQAPLVLEGALKDVRIWIAADLTTGGVTTGILSLATNPNGASVSFNGNAESGWWLLDDAASASTLADNSASSNTLDLQPTPSPDDYDTHSRTQLAFISKNLVADPGMENGGIGGITIVGTPSTNAKESDAVKDDSSIRVVADAAGEGFSHTVTTESDEDYVLRFYGKEDVGSYDVDITNGGGVVLDSLSGSTYVFQETCFESSSTSVVVQFLSEDYDNDFNIDDVKVFANHVSNGGVEGGANPPADWGAVTATVTSDSTAAQVHSGSNSMKIVAAGANEYAHTLALSNLEANSWYEVSAWMIGDAGSESVALQSSGLTGGNFNTSFTLTTSYRRYSQIFRTVSDTSGSILILANAASTFWADDISVIPRPDLDMTLTPLSTNAIYESARGNYSLLMTPGVFLYYDTIYGNKNQGSFIVRFRPQWSSDLDTSDGIDKYLFSWLSDATGIDIYDYVKCYYDASATQFVLELAKAATTNTSTTGAMVFEKDEYIEISGWWNVDGVVDDKDGTTYYVKILGNGEILGTNSTAITTAIPTTHMKHLIVGANNDTTSTTVGISEINALVGEVALFSQALSDEELRSYYISQEPIVNDNGTLVFSKTMADSDIFTYHTDTGVSEFYDASAGSRDAGDSSITGHNPTLRGDDLKEASIVYVKATNDIPKMNIVRRSYNH